MAQEHTILYASGAPERAVEDALFATMNTYRAIRDTDSRLPHPIIDRDLVAVTVALKPEGEGPDEDRILAVAQIGEIDNPALFETFTLKAVSRAFGQQGWGLATDTEPMERLAWLSRESLHEASSASVNGLHVGFAGGWAHHGRLLAVSFAGSLADTLGLDIVDAAKVPLFDEAESTERLLWLNNGQDSGDNTPLHAADRERYRFIFDKVAAPS